MKELALTVALYLILGACFLSGSLPGMILATIWFVGGGYMVACSRSRGLLADLSFLVTWPIYLALGR